MGVSVDGWLGMGVCVRLSINVLSNPYQHTDTHTNPSPIPTLKIVMKSFNGIYHFNLDKKVFDFLLFFTWDISNFANGASTRSLNSFATLLIRMNAPDWRIINRSKLNNAFQDFSDRHSMVVHVHL